MVHSEPWYPRDFAVVVDGAGFSAGDHEIPNTQIRSRGISALALAGITSTEAIEDATIFFIVNIVLEVEALHLEEDGHGEHAIRSRLMLRPHTLDLQEKTYQPRR